MLSIIIPALNEEKHLPILLGSIKRQGFDDYEIIVADAGSQDKTREIARYYNCKIVKGGKPAQGRNQGAFYAKGDLLLFLDADSYLPSGFLRDNLREFKKRNLKIASFCLNPLEKGRILFNIFYNFPALLMQRVLPHASMGILIEKKVFKKIRGFDETITLAEDHDLARRAKKFGKYGILTSKKLYVSERRFETDGWCKTAGKYLFSEIHMVLKGPVRKDLNYKFDHHLKNKDKAL
jgi:glycosyltransferase involved in cell wall biosynthesis